MREFAGMMQPSRIPMVVVVIHVLKYIYLYPKQIKRLILLHNNLNNKKVLRMIDKILLFPAAAYEN